MLFTNCKGDDDVDAKRSRPSIGKPVSCHARKERVLLFGTDQWITSGPAAKTIHGCTRTFREDVRFFSGRRPYMHEGCLRKPFRFYKSTDVRNPFWGFYFGRCDRLRRKLEHRGFLTFIKLGEQHHLSVGEFQRIMMSVGLVLVDLPKDGRRVIDHSRLPRKQPTWAAPYRSGEGKLCSREKANRRVGIFRCSKPYSARSEMLGCQFLSDLSWTRSYGLSAVVAHGEAPPLSPAPRIKARIRGASWFPLLHNTNSVERRKSIGSPLDRARA